MGLAKKILTVFICLQLVWVPMARASGSGQANLLMLASVLIAPQVLKQCKSKPSAWIFLGTTGFFLVSELANSGKYKVNIKSIGTDYTDSPDVDTAGSNKQIEALDAAAESSERAAKAADARSKNFSIAALGFAAAGAAAGVEGYLAMPGTNPSVPPPRDCIKPGEQGTCDRGACQKSSPASDWVNPDDAPTGAVPMKVPSRFWRLLGELLIPSVAAYMTQAVIGSAGSPFTGGYAGAASTAMNNAIGGGIQSGIQGVMGDSVWGTIKELLSGVTDMLKGALNDGFKRALIFGAYGALAALAASKTSSDAKSFRKRAEEYRKQAAKMRRRLRLGGGMNSGKLQYIPTKPRSGTSSSSSASSANFGSTNDPCVVRKQGQHPQIDSTCACRKNNSCMKQSMPKVDYPTEFSSAASTLNEAGGLLSEYANKAYNGDMSGASGLAESRLARTAAKVDRLKKQLWKMAGNHYKKHTGKGLDGSRLEAGYVSRLKKSINGGFRKLSSADRARLTALSPSLTNGPSLSDEKGSSQKNLVAKASGNKMVTGGGGATKSRLRGFESLEVPLEEEGDQQEVAEPASEMEKQDFAGNIIHNNPGESIWNVISQRYIRSFLSK